MCRVGRVVKTLLVLQAAGQRGAVAQVHAPACARTAYSRRGSHKSRRCGGYKLGRPGFGTPLDIKQHQRDVSNMDYCQTRHAQTLTRARGALRVHKKVRVWREGASKGAGHALVRRVRVFAAARR